MAPHQGNFASLRSRITNWMDDMKQWPPITTSNITAYLVDRREVDGLPTAALKSMGAYNYVESGWVGTVLVGIDAHGLVYLKAKICPSQSLNKSWHEATVCCEATGEILTEECNCMAGKGRTCSHVAAILFKVESACTAGMTTTSCTNQACSWNKGSLGNVMPLPLNKMDFKKPKHAPANITMRVSTQESDCRIERFTSEESYFQKIQMLGLESLFNIPGSQLNNSYQRLERAGFHGDHPQKLCEACNRFYSKYIHLRPRHITKIKNFTIMQSESVSNLWKETRSIRITASTASSVPKKSDTDPNTYVISHLFPTFTGNSSTRHGLQSENSVREGIELKFKCKVALSGVVISDNNPWLCCSPDGIMGDTVLEIKSPMNVNLGEFMSNSLKYDAEFTGDTATFTLVEGGTRGYYMQAQLTMFVLKLSKCLFVYYLAKDKTIIDISVDYNPSYISDVLQT